MKDDKVICNCYHITVGDLRSKIDEVDSFEEMQRITQISCCCKRCKDHARNVVEELLKEKKEFQNEC